jgi:uroporphyrinogen decarboxylase
MNRRDRILTTIQHKIPDRVPISFDFCSDEKQQQVLYHYGASNMDDLYRKTGIDCFSVWQPENAALPIYCGPPRPGIQKHDSTYGFWGKVGERIYPLAGVRLDQFHWPRWDEFDYSTLSDRLEAIRQSDFPAASGHAGLGWLHHVQMRGYDHALLDVLDDAWMEEYMGRNREFILPYFENLFHYADGKIDIIRADEDLGGHDRMLINPRTWRKWYRPLWKEIFDICHRNEAKVWLHSCGHCRPVVPDFIEIGADILNPIPPYVRGSDPGEMKALFGQALAFDGGVDQMNVLVQGTPEMVRREVMLRIDQLAPGGGYLLGPSQVITRDIPLENLVAMFDTALEYGQYGTFGQD